VEFEKQREKQVLGLGVDTGGTYTDCVVVDLNTGMLISKSKSFTTPYDFSQGIIKSIDLALGQGLVDVNDIKLVSISTTLATNSILQGKGWEVGIVLIGYQPAGIQELGAEIAFVRGGHDIQGKELEPLDEVAVKSAAENMARRVEAFAVSSYFGVRNYMHEFRARKIIEETVGLPVVCGHEMSPRLGMYERTVTAYFNARLLPIISEFIDKVKDSLKNKNINAPLMIVKGDGSLTSEVVARERPVETILSGPAASAIGAGVLSNLKDYVIVDIGGTSTDIGIVQNGFSKVNPEGAVVGGWRTRVRALDMRTVGLAGDSRIWVKEGKIMVGPERVVPLSLAVKDFPKLRDKIKFYKTTDFLMVCKREINEFDKGEREVYEVIAKLQPATLQEIYREKGLPASLLQDRVQRLKARYTVEGIGLTPTDLLHYQGIYTEFDAEIAKEGITIFASNMNLAPDEFVKIVMNIIYNNIAMEIAKKLLFDELGNESTCETCLSILDKALTGEGGNINFSVKAKYPIVAVGAPVKAYMPKIAEKLNTKLVIPPHYEVGNAIGAISGCVIESVRIEIVPGESGRCSVFGFGQPIVLPADEAFEYALNEAKRVAKERAIRAGAQNPQLKVEMGPSETKAKFLHLEMGNGARNIEEKIRKTGYSTISFGTEIVVTAIGKPAIAT
jgi:N-methylhydantoinase A/oxoprolinase/acetone carboxylase beta subunit